MSKQTSMRFGPATRRKLDALAALYGTATEAVAIAIDRMYREEVTMRNQYSVTDLYLDKSTNLLDLAGLSQDQIENQIADMVREHALDSEPDATDGEINTATEEAAHTILLEVRQAVVADIEARLTREDCVAWHGGEQTPTTAALISKYGEFQVWGMPDPEPGEEPLRVIWSAS